MYYNADPKKYRAPKPAKGLKKPQPRPNKATMLFSYQQLKLYADNFFSLYIRLIDSDKHGFVKCFTCEERKFYTQMQCGHFMKREHSATRYDERNAKPQDKDCNEFKGGAYQKFYFNLEKLYGKNITDELMELTRTTTKLSKDFLLETGNYYKQRVKELRSEKELSVLMASHDEDLDIIIVENLNH